MSKEFDIKSRFLIWKAILLDIESYIKYVLIRLFFSCDIFAIANHIRSTLYIPLFRLYKC